MAYDSSETSFDAAGASRRYSAVLSELQKARDSISRDLIDKFWDRRPSSEDEDRRQREDIRNEINRTIDWLRDVRSWKELQ